MTVKDVMSSPVRSVAPADTLVMAAKLMDQFDIGLLPVHDGTRVVGVITDRDITVRAVSAGKDPRLTRVDDVMTEDVHYCLADDPVDVVVGHMADKQIRRLLVFDSGGRLAGIVSLGDIAKRAGSHTVAEVLRRISMPSQPERVA